MKRVNDWGEEKPLGWSWYVTSGRTACKGFRWGIFGGSLFVPAGDGLTGLLGYDFREWLFRVPVLGVVLVIINISIATDAPSLMRTFEQS